MKLTPLLLSLLSLSIVARAEVTVQGPPDETRLFLAKGQSQVTLKGHSSYTVEASEIKAQVIVSTDGANQPTALSLHEDQKRNLLQKLQTIGITRGEVTVPKFATISPRYGATGESIIAYRAESTLTIEIKDQKQYLDLVGVLDKSREARLEGLIYNHAQLANLQKQIQSGACKQVMTRKEIYEQSLGLSLRPVSFTEEDVPDPTKRLDVSRFGQITIEAGVQVVFAIEPGTPPRPSPEPAAPKN